MPVQDERVVILLKPDALSGVYAVADSPRIFAFFSCLRASLEGCAYLDKADLLSPSLLLAAERAYRQISERAQNEEGFRSPIRQTSLCEAELLTCMQHYQHVSTPVPTREVIQQALLAFQFLLISVHQWPLSQGDIETCYADALAQQVSLREHLLTYLANQEVLLLELAGNQSMAALQRIKTYARYFFRYRNGEQHLLENLMHVPDTPKDRQYLLYLCTCARQRDSTPGKEIKRT